MGSWDETCGISGLPITPGDKTVLVLIHRGVDYFEYKNEEEENKSAMPDCSISGFTYPEDMYTPIAWPIYGVYKDQGDLGELEFVQRKLLAQALLIPFEIQASFSEEWFYELERGKIRFRGYHGPDRLGQLLIRRDIWDRFLALKAFDVHGEPTSLERTAERARALVDTLIADPINVQCAFRWDLTHLEKDYMWRLMQGLLFGPVQLLKEGVSNSTITREAAYEIADEIAKITFMNELFSYLRKAWRPQPGKGSQNTYWGLHADAANIVKDVAQVYVKKEESEEDE